MDTHQRLRSAFVRIAALALAAGATVACSSTLDRDGFGQSYCTNGRYEPLAGLSPKSPVDYLELRVVGEPPRVDAATGTKCKAAPDRAKCEQAIDQARSTTGISTGGQAAQLVYFVYSRGAEVGVITDSPGLVSFLAPIGTPTEAALLARYQGHGLVCPDGQNARSVANGMEIITQTGSGCPDDVKENRTFVSNAGLVEVRESTTYKKGDSNCVVGRRPVGLAPAPTVAHTSAGDYMARAAELEGASIHAFVALARELEALGAPPELARRALLAAADEARHARATEALARRLGGSPARRSIAADAGRTAFAIALENAVEGCVRETFGAVVATFQASRAADPDVADAMAEIAADETRHAALAWDVAAWLEPSLSQAERAAIAEAKRRAVAEVALSLADEPSPEARRILGLPDAGESVTILDAMTRDVWAA
ncbi:MAG: hypothetical protein JNL38_06130 [Myxococcales bacterium]|nr:hypothetical protein [Myxococcales bacterium]